MPVDTLTSGRDDHAVRDLFTVDADPARAVAADCLDVELVGLELHGPMSLLRCGSPAELWSNCSFHPRSALAGGALKTVHKSAKLANVLYDIRGPIMDAARRMEEEGHKIIRLNIGNLAVFGFDAPEEIQQDMARNLPNSAAYSDSKGIFAARKAVMHETQKQGIKGVTLDDIYLGNGASELIAMATNALLDDGDELLLPTPDYPLWTACTSLSGGKPVHDLCEESNGWMPDVADIERKITPRTKGLVVINPNNPTGALYSDELLKEIVAIARQHGLVILADEVYDKVLYDGVKHTAIGSLSE